ncbi:hypothetical protein FPZ42_06880 [Mucilaginibacter achroorhodeus]|uniref:Uncharacterized protein n=1 Tax=Mucilaginibacter achroorhodeus TaxID=2599294 RepID=A0A563U5Z5_9SPHI|nr:hypothetical protein [Mucilaginibacter achroorhodeus]TWR26755.1 hypothetical protein FPZ42_06880 [Mucilaginibacter achroorhodeus]
MKKIMIIFAGMLFFSPRFASAQAILDKMDRATDKADRAGHTADRTKSTGEKILGFFGKKKDGTATEKTTVKIAGVNFSTLKAINDKLQSAKGVQSTKMKFKASGSSIVLEHSGSTSDILKSLQKAAPDVFAEKNIDGMDDGEISVKVN